MKKSWTTTKLVTLGSLAVLKTILQLFGAGIQTLTGIIGMGGITNGFVTPFVVILCLLATDQFGSATIMLLVQSLLILPLPLTGTSGFLPKVPILLTEGFIADILYLFLKRNKRVAAPVIGGLLLLYIGFAIVETGRLFGLPGIEQTAKLYYSYGGLVVAPVVGATSGYLGYLIYEKVKDTAVVKRIQS